MDMLRDSEVGNLVLILYDFSVYKVLKEKLFNIMLKVLYFNFCIFLWKYFFNVVIFLIIIKRYI